MGREGLLCVGGRDTQDTQTHKTWTGGLYATGVDDHRNRRMPFRSHLGSGSRSVAARRGWLIQIKPPHFSLFFAPRTGAAALFGPPAKELCYLPILIEARGTLRPPASLGPPAGARWIRCSRERAPW